MSETFDITQELLLKSGKFVSSTIATEALNNNGVWSEVTIPFEKFAAALDIKIDYVENIIALAIYKNIIVGRIDQMNELVTCQYGETDTNNIEDIQKIVKALYSFKETTLRKFCDDIQRVESESMDM